MEFFDVVKHRRSVRKYETRDIEQEKLEVILQTINAAPSAGNLQGYDVVLVRDQTTRNAISTAAFGQPYVAQAPLALVFCANHLLSSSKYGDRGGGLYSVQDATIAATYCQLAASALGLATVWIGAFNPEAVALAIGAPGEVTPVAVIPIGYPAEHPSQRPRRDLKELVHKEKF